MRLTRLPSQYRRGSDYTSGTQAAPIGSPSTGTFTAIDGKTNKIAWQHKTPYRMGGGGGSTVTAGGLVFRGEPDGNFVALDAKTGEVLWKFQTGFGADAPPSSTRSTATNTSPSLLEVIPSSAARTAMRFGPSR